MPSRPRVELTCMVCDRNWSMIRRKGQYPSRCTACVRKGRLPPLPPMQHAQHLVTLAAADGIGAAAYRHSVFGWSAWVVTPFHDGPVRLVDEHDVRYLAAELSHAA